MKYFRLEMAYVGGAYLKPAAEYDAEDADDSATTVASSKNVEAAATKGMQKGLKPEMRLIIFVSDSCQK